MSPAFPRGWLRWPDAEARRELWRRGRGQLARALVQVRRRVPPGFRLPLGILLICGGFLAILPFFGLWMIPLGISVAALDVAEWRRRSKERRR